jgi:hypothetical protein
MNAKQLKEIADNGVKVKAHKIKTHIDMEILLFAQDGFYRYETVFYHEDVADVLANLYTLEGYLVNLNIEPKSKMKNLLITWI